MSLSYVELIEATEAHVTRLNELEDNYVVACEQLTSKEADWQQHSDEFLAELIESYARKSERLPGEDVRSALARNEHREKWDAYRKWKRIVERIERELRLEADKLSARQSQLSAQRAEGNTNPHQQEPSWSAA